MKVAVIDYGAGNLTSVRKALAFLHANVQIVQNPNDLTGATAVIVPGVGHFKATATLDDTWRKAILNGIHAGRAFLGICLGMQWLFEGSDEDPTLRGLGLIPGHCSLLDGASQQPPNTVKIPHVGWNSLHMTRSSWLLEGVDEGSQVYFTHSFAAPITQDCITTTTHGGMFASAVENERICGMQFHPEKSGAVGLKLLGNFLLRAHRK